MRTQPRKSLIAAALLIAATSSGANAQNHDAELNLGVGRILFDDVLEDATNYHLGIGYVIDNQWTLEVVANEFTADIERTNAEVRGTQYRLDALYHLGDEVKWRPYAAFGVGDQRLSPEGGDPSHETLVNAGIGFKHRFSPNWEWRTDVRAFNNIDEEYTDVVFSTGISFLFGASAQHTSSTPAVVAVVPVAVKDTDSDGDGVLDSRDRCPNTERRYKVDDEGCVLKLITPVSIKLAVIFGLSSAEVQEQYIEDIRDLATFMNQYESTMVTVEGHTDSSGSSDFNKALSQRRAEAVRDILVQRMDIESDRVVAIGYGEEQPIADNSTDLGRAANRRVMATVSTDVTVIERREQESVNINTQNE